MWSTLTINTWGSSRGISISNSFIVSSVAIRVILLHQYMISILTINTCGSSRGISISNSFIVSGVAIRVSVSFLPSVHLLHNKSVLWWLVRLSPSSSPSPIPRFPVKGSVAAWSCHGGRDGVRGRGVDDGGGGQSLYFILPAWKYTHRMDVEKNKVNIWHKVLHLASLELHTQKMDVEKNKGAMSKGKWLGYVIQCLDWGKG